jgi:hypothetical protein
MATSRRYPISCTLGLMLGGLACQALAEPPPATPSNDNGLMTFKHVRVINAPSAAEHKPVADASSMQAFIDPITRELRAPTAEEARQLSNVASARTRAGILTNNAATNASTDDSERLIYGPDNTVGLLLTDADMVSQKVHLDADGNLIQECLTGEDAAAHAAHDHTEQESHNDR